MPNKFHTSVFDYRNSSPPEEFFIVITADPTQADTFTITNSCYSVKVNPVQDENAYISCYPTATFVCEEANPSSSSLQLKWEIDKSKAEETMKDEQLKELVDFAGSSLRDRPSVELKGDLLKLFGRASKSLTDWFEYSKLPDDSVDTYDDVIINPFTIGIEDVAGSQAFPKHLSKEKTSVILSFWKRKVSQKKPCISKIKEYARVSFGADLIPRWEPDTSCHIRLGISTRSNDGWSALYHREEKVSPGDASMEILRHYRESEFPITYRRVKDLITVQNCLTRAFFRTCLEVVMEVEKATQFP
ncbi:MAG: hypothetical protein TREMPRED_002557 [Tremellales sp. Tagirdzhanova-0007]|nr:MAG: hypothetical protein TREMPRED_002557 [Tremellales sp. Tagirdzhanova-0007]